MCTNLCTVNLVFDFSDCNVFVDKNLAACVGYMNLNLIVRKSSLVGIVCLFMSIVEYIRAYDNLAGLLNLVGAVGMVVLGFAEYNAQRTACVGKA